MIRTFYRLHVVAVVALALLFAGQTTAPTTAPKPAPHPSGALPLGAKYLRDIPYVTHGHARQKLDIVTLATKEPAPLIVWIHGGGWTEGEKSVARAAPFYRDGYAVAAIDYRLSQDAVFPAQIEDCKAAIRFLRAHAKEYNINPDKIGVWGESAGGHLAALVGTSGDMKALQGEHPENAGVSDKVECVVDYFGPTDMAQLPAMAGGKYDPNVLPGLLLTKLFGGPIEQKKELVASANPIKYITASTPPFLIVHGTADGVVPVAQSRILYEALKKAGDKVTYLPIKDARHGPGVYGNATVWNSVKALFAENLMGQPAAKDVQKR